MTSDFKPPLELIHRGFDQEGLAQTCELLLSHELCLPAWLSARWRSYLSHLCAIPRLAQPRAAQPPASPHEALSQLLALLWLITPREARPSAGQLQALGLSPVAIEASERLVSEMEELSLRPYEPS